MSENDDTLEYVLFDLDETLYRKETGLMDLVSQRITEYMRLRLKMDCETVDEVRRRYYERYGTTSRGLYVHHNLDQEDYFSFVHDVPVEECLKADAGLNRMLANLEVAKVVFTNSTVKHARRVLRALGVDSHFQRIIDISDLDYIPKPDIRAYQKALALLETRAERCVLVDDHPPNLGPGKQLGMITVLIGNQPAAEGVDYILEQVTELGQLLDHI